MKGSLRGMLVVSNPFLRFLFHPAGRHRHCFHQNSEAKRPLFIAPRPIKLLRRLSTEAVPWHCEGGLLGSCLFLAQVAAACNFLEFRIYKEPNFQVFLRSSPKVRTQKRDKFLQPLQYRYPSSSSPGQIRENWQFGIFLKRRQSPNARTWKKLPKWEDFFLVPIGGRPTCFLPYGWVWSACMVEFCEILRLGC